MSNAKPGIDRGEFLRARMAYLARMRHEGVGEESMINACNLTDVVQVRLLLATWDDREGLGGNLKAVTREDVARLEMRVRALAQATIAASGAGLPTGVPGTERAGLRELRALAEGAELP